MQDALNLGLQALWQWANAFAQQKHQCSALHVILMSETENPKDIIPIITTAQRLQVGCYQIESQFQKVKKRFFFFPIPTISVNHHHHHHHHYHHHHHHHQCLLFKGAGFSLSIVSILKRKQKI